MQEGGCREAAQAPSSIPMITKRACARCGSISSLPLGAAFNARLTWATLHHMQLLHSEEDLPRIAYVSLEPTLVFVGFTTRPDPPMLWGGGELQTGRHNIPQPRRAVPSADDRPLQLEPDGTGSTSTSKDMEDAVTGKALSAPPAARILRPAARDAARLRRLHAQACRLAETRPKVLAHPEVARAIEQGLIHALVTCLAARARDDGAARRHHTRIMVRFEEVLADHPNRQLHLPELCALIGVSRADPAVVLRRVSGYQPQPVHAPAAAEGGADRAARCRPGHGKCR